MIESNGTDLGDHSMNNNSGSQPESQESQTSENPLQKRIQELESQVKEKDQKYVYLYAEFENFKKRAVKERSDLIKFGWESTARELLQTVDNLERALAHIPAQTEKSLVDGLNMVLSQFKSSLEKQGVREIEALEKDFDPNLHEAVGQEPSSSAMGKVIKEHNKGYTLNGRLLRPSRVILSAGPAQTS